MSTWWSALHWIRPQWLWALALLPVIWGVCRWRQRRKVRWQQVVDPHLLGHLLAGQDRQPPWGVAVVMIGFVLAVLALAGPSWRMLAQPSWQAQRPLVITLDLSSSITATDLPPSRLLQARAKIDHLLRQRRGGDIALVAYAGDAFTVAPLTADVANLRLFLDELAPGIMPVQGNRADRGIAQAAALLTQANARAGDIVVLTGQVDAGAVAAARKAAAAGYTVSALGVGSVSGASYRQADGALARTFLDESSLEQLAAAGAGRYQRVSVDDADLQQLGVLNPDARSAQSTSTSLERQWQDEGYWLLPPLMALALLAFRRRALLVVLLTVGCLPLATPVYAAEGSWWQRADQLQYRRISQGVDAYRRGDFATAQKQFESINSAEGLYNLGNALARQGQYDKAIEAYDRALVQQPGMEDAIANRAAVEAARKRKPPPSEDNSDAGKSPPSPQGQGAPEKGKSSDPSQGGLSEDEAGKRSDAGPSQPSSPPSAGQEKGNEAQDAPAGEDAQRQQQADQAQREQMEEAMQQAKPGQRPPASPAVSAQARERQQAVDAWLQRVPDTPGSVLKAKFQLEYERRQREGR